MYATSSYFYQKTNRTFNRTVAKYSNNELNTAEHADVREHEDVAVSAWNAEKWQHKNSPQRLQRLNFKERHVQSSRNQTGMSACQIIGRVPLRTQADNYVFWITSAGTPSNRLQYSLVTNKFVQVACTFRRRASEVASTTIVTSFHKVLDLRVNLENWMTVYKCSCKSRRRLMKHTTAGKNASPPQPSQTST
jgi:hypothetical protein